MEQMELEKPRKLPFWYERFVMRAMKLLSLTSRGMRSQKRESFFVARFVANSKIFSECPHTSPRGSTHLIVLQRRMKFLKRCGPAEWLFQTATRPQTSPIKRQSFKMKRKMHSSS